MVNKTLHYRYAQITKSNNTLQELFHNAIHSDELCIADNRQENFNSNSKEFRMINAIKEESSMLFGQLILVCPEQAQVILNMESGATTYTINPFSLNDDNVQEKKIKKEFINSILYFLIYKNHVVIMQSKALSTRDLETHLFWFLDKANQLNDNSEFILQTQPPKETIEEIEKTPVKAIKIGSALAVSKPEKNDKTTDKDVSETKSLKLKNALSLDILKTILPQWIMEERKLVECFDDANLQVNLEIFYSRKTTTKGQEFIDTIATSLRHIVNEDNLKIHLKGGGTLDGDKLQLSTSIKIDLVNNLIDETNLLKQMKEWLMSKISNEDINE